MKPVDLLLHLEAYIALERALGFSLRARKVSCAISWHSSKPAASGN